MSEHSALLGGAGQQRGGRRVIAAAVAATALVAAIALVYTASVLPVHRTTLVGVSESLKARPLVERVLPESVKRQMDLTVDPCDDFYEYSCGGFLKNVKIPEDLGGFARSWDGGSAKIYNEMRKVLEQDTGPAGDWYHSCMMLDQVNELGATPLKPYLAQIEKIKTYEDLWAVMAEFQFWDVPAFFDWWVGADNLEPMLRNLYLGTGGLILPDYTFYTEDSEEMKSHRAAYRTFIVEQLTLAGRTPEEAEHDADVTVEIETELAVYQRLEPYVTLKQSFVHISQKELYDTYPNIAFATLFKKMKIEDVGTERDNIVVKAPDFFHKLNDFFDKHSPESLIPYLRWHLVYNLSPLLSQGFLDATLKVDANLMGISKQPERWHKCVAASKAALPMVVDRLFIEHFFSEHDRQIALTMLDYIRAAFKADLEKVAWMSEESRTAALEKLHNIFFECGHPTEWAECDWPVSRTSYFNNSLASCAAKKRRKLARLEGTPDRRRWSMSVMSVNSYYDNAVNGLFITAGMLQKPFFDADYDMARNFGGVGAIMGHELTHGFDNTGRKYDQNSRLKDWWDKETIEEFNERSQCIASLYGGFEMLGLKLHGNLTLGENIADFGGLKASYHAWLEWFRDHHCKGIDKDEMPMTWELCEKTAKPLLSQKQLFWISYGQNWCDKERDQSIKMSIATDEHSPDKFRVNGPLSQNDEFAADFACPIGSNMNPVKRCVLW